MPGDGSRFLLLSPPLPAFPVSRFPRLSPFPVRRAMSAGRFLWRRGCRASSVPAGMVAGCQGLSLAGADGTSGRKRGNSSRKCAIQVCYMPKVGILPYGKTARTLPRPRTWLTVRERHQQSASVIHRQFLFRAATGCRASCRCLPAPSGKPEPLLRRRLASRRVRQQKKPVFRYALKRWTFCRNVQIRLRVPAAARGPARGADTDSLNKKIGISQ